MSSAPRSVVDTVVLRYFLLVDELDLLVALLEQPLGVPRIVYDPDEGTVPEAARSELTRSIAFQRRASADPARDRTARSQASANAERLAGVAAAASSGLLVTLDLSPSELEIVSRVTSPSESHSFGLIVPLGPGEAACLAVGTKRGLVIATDDGDALKALLVLAPGHPHERIRKLLIRGVKAGLVTEHRANDIHREMRTLGFWDREPPFPNQHATGS